MLRKLSKIVIDDQNKKKATKKKGKREKQYEDESDSEKMRNDHMIKR